MVCIFALLTLAAHPAQAAETKAPPAPQARAFLDFPEADRKAMQDALGWLGFYNGVDDGAYGKRTIDALTAYQQSVGAPADGVLVAKTLAALKDAAGKAKAAFGFRLVDDPTTGIRIGAPTKWLEKRASGAGTSALTSKDGAIGLYLKEAKGDLATLYKSVSADAGERKVAYKYLKAGAFFVTTGEEGADKFYRRYAADGDKLRGFAFIYPKARAKALDPVALAVANSFEPFPSAPPPAAPPTPAPAPPAPKLSATALVVAPGVAVTALDPALCKAPTIAGKPAHFLEPQGPLTRLGGEFGAGATPPPLGVAGGELVALSLAPSGNSDVLKTTPARTLAGGGVLAAVGVSASGAPLFDRQGRLVGFVGAVISAPRRGGVALAAPHATLPPAGIGAADGEGGPALPAAEIARLRRAGVVGVFCGA